ncbi:MAG: sulfotransferase family 2 domain-containing protein [Nocardioides sp.]
MLISDTHQLVFVHVQKTGGVTVGQVLEEAVPDVRRWPERGVKHATLSQLLDAEPAYASYWTFAFVRNPWSRLVSWWSMVERFDELARQGVERAQARFDNNAFLRTSREYADFEAFVMQGPEELERLRTPQLTYLSSDKKTVDFVGRTESFRADLGHVFDHLGVAFPSELPHRNKSPHAHYTTYYSAASRERVAALFAPDIEAFGYEFGPAPTGP